jgi:peptidoglycan/xylan/chitin deacetylase (PgdA/CDA1 family)
MKHFLLMTSVILMLASCVSGANSSKLVALSFDDGPTEDITPLVLDILEEFNVPASFFVIGQNINESSARHMNRALALGCEIQNHSFTHSAMTQLSIDQVKDEIKRTDELIEQYTGKHAWLFRPPFIDQNQAMHDAVAHTFISGINCLDWEPDRTAQMRFEDVVSKVKDGDIILLHDFPGNINTVDALRLIIPELKKQGYNFVTVSQLFKEKGISPEPHSGYLYTNVLQTERF